MAQVARKPAEYSDIVALPPHVVGQIIDGELIVSPRPAGAHASASSAMGADINAPYHRRKGSPGGPGGWWILFEPELHLGGHVLVPDLAGWRRERMPAKPAAAWFSLPPDWVCEVISPSSAGRDRIRKSRIYRQQGVEWMWIVDPDQRSVEVYQAAGEHWMLLSLDLGDERATRLPPFTEVAIDLLRWWGEDDLPPEGESP